MSIDPARIEAAARAFDEQFDAHLSRDVAERMLVAAFPELVPEIFDGLPHAWIAPWEATQAMAFACGTVTPTEANRIWQTMRDAHLKEKQT